MKNLYKILLVVALIAVAIFAVRQMTAAFIGVGGESGGIGLGIGGRRYHDDRYYDNRPYYDSYYDNNL